MSEKKGRIFISHAGLDLALVKELVGLLQTGLDLSRKQIFCTSLEGMRIPPGVQFVEHLRKELTGADYVIMLVSPSYYESPYCMCELGGTWALSARCSPLVVPPITYKTLQGVLNGAQVGSIDDERALNDLHDALDELEIGDAASGRWETERDAFLNKLKRLLKKLPGRTVVPADEFKAANDKYDAAQDKISGLEAEIEKKDEYIQELEKAKNKDDVKAIKKRYEDNDEAFADLCKAASSAIGKLPSAARKALYYSFKDEVYVLGEYHVYKDDYEDADNAADDDYVTKDERVVRLNDTHPRVKKAWGALEELSGFMSEAKSDFEEEFEEEYDFPFNIHNREFWSKILGV